MDLDDYSIFSSETPKSLDIFHCLTKHNVNRVNDMILETQECFTIHFLNYIVKSCYLSCCHAYYSDGISDAFRLSAVRQMHGCPWNSCFT